MAVTLRAIAIIEIIVLLFRLPRIPDAITTLATELGATPIVVSLFAVAILLVSAWGSIQLWRLRPSGLLINRVLAGVSIPLVFAKYWSGNWANASTIGLAVVCQVAVAAMLFSPAAARACGSTLRVGSEGVRAGEPAT